MQLKPKISTDTEVLSKWGFWFHKREGYWRGTHAPGCERGNSCVEKGNKRPNPISSNQGVRVPYQVSGKEKRSQKRTAEMRPAWMMKKRKRQITHDVSGKPTPTLGKE